MRSCLLVSLALALPVGVSAEGLSGGSGALVMSGLRSASGPWSLLDVDYEAHESARAEIGDIRPPSFWLVAAAGRRSTVICGAQPVDLGMNVGAWFISRGDDADGAR